MNMTTLQERRHAEIIAQIARVSERRDSTIARLALQDGKLRKLKRQLARLERGAATPAPMPTVASAPAAPPPSPDVEVKPMADLGDDIPGFLRRAPGNAKDEAAAAEIVAAQAAKKKQKSRVRVERMKAKARGDLRKMPVSGREALAVIRAR